DDHPAADVEDVEDAVDGVTGGGVAGLLVAAAQPVDGVERGVLGGADELEFDDALQGVRAAHRRQGRAAHHGTLRAAAGGEGWARGPPAWWFVEAGGRLGGGRAPRGAGSARGPAGASPSRKISHNEPLGGSRHPPAATPRAYFGRISESKTRTFFQLA